MTFCTPLFCAAVLITFHAGILIAAFSGPAAAHHNICSGTPPTADWSTNPPTFHTPVPVVFILDPRVTKSTGHVAIRLDVGRGSQQGRIVPCGRVIIGLRATCQAVSGQPPFPDCGPYSHEFNSQTSHGLYTANTSLMLPPAFRNTRASYDLVVELISVSFGGTREEFKWALTKGWRLPSLLRTPQADKRKVVRVDS